MIFIILPCFLYIVPFVKSCKSCNFHSGVNLIIHFVFKRTRWCLASTITIYQWFCIKIDLRLCIIVYYIYCNHYVRRSIRFNRLLDLLVFTQQSYCHGTGVCRPSVVCKLMFPINCRMDPGQILWGAPYPPYLQIIFFFLFFF